MSRQRLREGGRERGDGSLKKLFLCLCLCMWLCAMSEAIRANTFSLWMLPILYLFLSTAASLELSEAVMENLCIAEYSEPDTVMFKAGATVTDPVV